MALGAYLGMHTIIIPISEHKHTIIKAKGGAAYCNFFTGHAPCFCWYSVIANVSSTLFYAWLACLQLQLCRATAGALVVT